MWARLVVGLYGWKRSSALGLRLPTRHRINPHRNTLIRKSSPRRKPRRHHEMTVPSPSPAPTTPALQAKQTNKTDPQKRPTATRRRTGTWGGTTGRSVADSTAISSRSWGRSWGASRVLGHGSGWMVRVMGELGGGRNVVWSRGGAWLSGGVVVVRVAWELMVIVGSVIALAQCGTGGFRSQALNTSHSHPRPWPPASGSTTRFAGPARCY